MAEQPYQAPRVLIAYGVPATMALSDLAGRPLGKTFELTAGNKASFEVALRRALTTFMKGDVMIPAARFTFIRNAGEFVAAVRSANYTQVVYYGHVLEGVNALLPTATNRITATQLAAALSGTTVSHFDILGCQSASIAAELSALLPKVRVGYLRARDSTTLNAIRGPSE